MSLLIQTYWCSQCGNVIKLIEIRPRPNLIVQTTENLIARYSRESRHSCIQVYMYIVLRMSDIYIYDNNGKWSLQKLSYNDGYH